MKSSLKKVDPLFPFSNSFNKALDNFFQHGLHEMVGSDQLLSRPSVNISENDSHYTVELAAPGLHKEDFQITVEGRRLTISAEKTQKNAEENETKWRRREFNYTTFSRSFTLPKGIQEDHITASFENGVLVLQITKPVQPESQKTRIEIR